MEAAYREWTALRAEEDAAAADYRQLKWVTEREIAELKSREDFAQRVAAEAKERADQAYAAYLAARVVADAEAEAKEANFWNTGAGSMTTLEMAEQNRLLAQAQRGVERALKADIEAWCARVPLADRAYVAVKESRCWDCFVKTEHRDGPASDPMALPMCQDCYVSWTTER